MMLQKLLFIFLVKRLKEKGFKYIDCQIPTEHLRSFGAKEIPRETFFNSLKRINNQSQRVLN